MRCCSKTLILLMVFLCQTALRAADSAVEKPTYHASLAAAYDAAALNNSMVLLIFGADWCGPCKLLKKNTLGAEEFQQRGGPLRIFEVNIDTDEKTTKAFNVSAVPTLFLLSPDGKIISRHSGYLEVSEMLKWLDQGRERLKQGQWEGIVAGGEFKELAAKAGTGSLETNDLQRLLGMLAQSDPAERLSAGRLLLSQGERAVPFLIDALADPYLGTRIAASELLQKLSPAMPQADPWQSPAELGESIAKLKAWWAQTGKLPSPIEARVLDPTLEGSIKSSLEAVRGNDPMARTDAMSTLVNHGTAALPRLREAIKASETRGDPRSIALLEDIFWAILIPDSVEKRAGHVRAVLARGTSPDRQQAAARLGRAGREAIPALADLVNDADGLVAEKAVRALSSVGGKDAILAMGALLKATDSNLRMTAAQALGKTKNPEARQVLLTALGDENEIVVCTALAALEEVLAKANSSSGSGKATPELTAALKKCLSDNRWRVRATAVEITGKLLVRDLAADVKKLVNDQDGFVVKNALVTVQSLGSPPEPAELASLAKRLPSLRRDAVEMLIRLGSEEAVKTVTEMFEQAQSFGNTEECVMILNALARSEDRNAQNPWRSLLANTASSPEAAVRRATVDVLATSPLLQAAESIGPLLTDRDAETRAKAAEVVVAILAGKRRVVSRMGGSDQVYAAETTEDNSGRTVKTNVVYATPTQIKSWHAALEKAANTGIYTASALYVTGDGTTDLPVLLAALDALEPKTMKQFYMSPAVGAISRKLPWPEGKPVLEKFSANPVLFALAVTEAPGARPEARAFLLEPQRFKSTVEPTSGDELMLSMQLLLSGGNLFEDESRFKWSLLKPSEPTEKILSLLLSSTNAGWRAASLHVLGKLKREKQIPEFEQALQDPNPWVRIAGAKALSHCVTEPSALETRIGPLLKETNEWVARNAAMALLQPEVRMAAGLEWSYDYFLFDGKPISTQVAYFGSENEQRPLVALNSKPAFLEDARRYLKQRDREKTAIFVLLLAQYGQFEAIETLAGSIRPAGDEDEPEVFEEISPGQTLMAAISLSHDKKFLPLLRKFMEPMKQDYELRQILKAMRGMSGPEARELRLEVNRRMRQRANVDETPFTQPPVILND